MHKSWTRVLCNRVLMELLRVPDPELKTYTGTSVPSKFFLPIFSLACLMHIYADLANLTLSLLASLLNKAA